MTVATVTAGCRERVHKKKPKAELQFVTERATEVAPGASGVWSCGEVHDATPLRRQLGARGRFSLGAIADTKEARPETLTALEGFARRFATARVDAVAVLGDIGRSAEEIERVLVALRGAGAPLLAIAGERESENSFHDGVKRARNDGVDVVDLVEKRLIDGGKIDIVSLPGYPFSERGCRYRAHDLDGVRALLQGRDGKKPLVVLGHIPPRGEGAEALDWSWGKSNVGDREVARLIEDIAPTLGLFAHVDEAGGHTLATGKQLLVNVGSADAVGGAHAAIVTLADGKLTYEALP
jgi:hypothetical protein